MKIDELDVRIVELFSEDAGIGVLAASRLLGVARATVQSRLDKLRAAGVVQGMAPTLNPANFGYPVMAIVSIEIVQGMGHVPVGTALREIPEIVEMYTVSGDHDVMVRVVARSNDDLQRVLDSVSSASAVNRTRSVVVLQTHFQNRVLPLFAHVGGAAERNAE
ncbi:Lrp/AsnC family transcriptional regulator [Kocuria tytonis]|uniref:Lrp/AsnC family transcriptional regulator n=1 Tax=Kocuria tytonis TaxID=2054280 RepID=A0A495A427_9MICC|nr:Lrp/AsnC family transcriptional regulator [Kocuria tytonis]RKQ33745.1 Lrp/AsnC family transcriptional regulator [Kocuria tytonis]